MNAQPRLPGVTSPRTYTPTVARLAIARGRLALAEGRRRGDLVALDRRRRALTALGSIHERTTTP